MRKSVYQTLLVSFPETVIKREDICGFIKQTYNPKVTQRSQTMNAIKPE